MESRMKKLEQIQAQMRNIERRRRENAKKMSEIYDKIRLIQARTVKDIALETDGLGSRVYSNESLRRAELRIRLSENEEYQRLQEEVRPLREIDQKLGFEWNLLVDKRDLLIAPGER